LSTDTEPRTPPRLRLKDLPLDKLEVGPTNVRRRLITADLDELAQSLEEIGLQQPLLVQPRNSHYDVLVGQRRFLAAKKLGWQQIQALVPDRAYDEREAVLVSLSENVHRRDLESNDKAEAVEYLLRELGTVAEVARALGMSEATVRKWRGYSTLVPDSIKSLVGEKKVTAHVALKLSQSIPDEERALKVAQFLAVNQPAKGVRDRILDAVQEYSDRPADVILARAEEAKEEVEITFVLTARHARAMEAAAREMNKEQDLIARDATVEWLERNRF
jgi:ParB/RepB/Spo0J family partition protein